MNPVQDASCDCREFILRRGAVNDGDAVSIHAEMTTSGIDDLKAIAFLFSDVTRPQLIGVEEFNDLTFKEHEKISFSTETRLCQTPC